MLTLRSHLLASPFPLKSRVTKMPISISVPSSRPPTVCRNSSLTTTTTTTTTTNQTPTPPPLSPSPPATSAYIHLPFCRRRCHYCDFPIVALGSSSSSDDENPMISNYIDLLLREISATAAAGDRRHRPPLPPLDTIYFGGGTPSLVPPRLVSSVLDALREKFGVGESPEISIEMDPGTFDAARLDSLLGFGINRVSLGVQAFQEELLVACGRAHGVREVYEAIEIVTVAGGGGGGLENWSMDLISSLPHQTAEMWEESLRSAVEAGPTHVSVYDLQVEQGTKFGRLYTPGEFPLPTENQSASLYKMASETLTRAGYNHYEISSYCKAGYECRHNLTYWQNRPFYAFGLGSTSYLSGVRFARPRKIHEYADYVQKLENGGDGGGNSNGVVDARDTAMDVLMLSLRTARGLDVKSFTSTFGDSIAAAVCNCFEPYVESGHVVVLDKQRRVLSRSEFGELLQLWGDDSVVRRKGVAFIRLADPDGFLLSNELISIAFGVISNS